MIGRWCMLDAEGVCISLILSPSLTGESHARRKIVDIAGAVESVNKKVLLRMIWQILSVYGLQMSLSGQGKAIIFKNWAIHFLVDIAKMLQHQRGKTSF